MTEIERLLVEAGKEMDFPGSPDLSSRVGRLLPEQPERRLTGPKRGRRVALVVAALILLAAGTAIAASPGLRDSVLDLFRLSGTTVERTTPIPSAPVRPGNGLDLGARTTLRSARRALPFHVLVPARVGRPRGVFLRARAVGGYVSLSYRATHGLPEARETGLGLLVSEFRGRFDPDYLGKIVGLGTRVRRFSIDGAPAAWLSGAPHDFYYRGPSGRERQRTLRLAANVLLVERGGVLVRLEGGFHRAKAVSIARSLR
jgi:hypothetical protein